MHILVLQHERVEHPGIFRSFLKADNRSWDAVELDEGEALPDLDGYDALWVMGGPMDTWQEDAHPWLRDEKRYIAEAVRDRDMPFLGFCLGHQLLANALGGAVAPAQTPEIGIMEVHRTDTNDPGDLFDGLPLRFNCLQWHSAEVTGVPEGAQILARSPACAVQAMRWGERALSMQFHIEIEANTVETWSHIPEYKEALEALEALEAPMGAGSVPAFEAQATQNMADFNQMARRLYTNWMRVASRTQVAAGV
ncbi:MAG: type 1 glutamine amidotransferase [Pseudomonadota bacterium]